VFVLWNLLTILGAVLGNAIGDPKVFGLDALAPAAFCALLWPRLKSGDARAVAAVSALIALAVAPHAPAGIPVLVAALAAVVAGLLPRRDRDDPVARDGGRSW
jgi:predicted branched-subunit amino acid permease